MHTGAKCDVGKAAAGEAPPPRPPILHFQRPEERPFLAADRDRVTILFGGVTLRHEKLIQAIFEGNGYNCELLPTPDVAAFQYGKQYGNNSQCSPTYFTTGFLIQYLKGLEAQGLTRREIVDKYIYFSAGSCGPCRFGMYESEYRYALENAGFEGFRVLLFEPKDGINAASGEPGLVFTCDFGTGMFKALLIADVLTALCHTIRPYEVIAGETDRVFGEAVDELCHTLRDHEPFEILDRVPPWLSRRLASWVSVKNRLNSAGKVWDHLYSPAHQEALRACLDRIGRIEVDYTRAKPIVKITGEFWAQTTEGDGNFKMFSFLESEGAQVHTEPISTLVMYLLYQAKAKHSRSKELAALYDRPGPRARAKAALNFHLKRFLLSIAERFWARQYQRVVEALGGLTEGLVSQQELADLANPFYHSLMRGGEGHLEVAKNIYYHEKRLAHMVLGLKPFGCMPSAQSDGVQSAVVNKFPEMIYLPIETSGEGAIHAHSRVQMALADAKAKTRAEFQEALDSAGRSLDEIRAYVADHPQLRSPLYPVPRGSAIGRAANFVVHVGDLMAGRADLAA